MTNYTSDTGHHRIFRRASLLLAGCFICLAANGFSADAPFDKNAAHAQMLDLATQMRGYKPQIRTSASAAQSYATAQTLYQQWSLLLGGDDPAHIGGAPGALPVDRLVQHPAKSAAAPTACGSASATFTQPTAVAIPTGPAVVTSTLVVSGAGPYLYDVNVQTFLQHTFSADLDVTITSPAGTVVTLTTDNGAGNDNVFNGTVWDDSANPGGQVPYTTNNGLVTDTTYANLVVATPLVPEEPLGAFIGENPNGTWTITISDDLAGDGGSLDSWSLTLTTFPTAPTITTFPRVTQSTPVAISAVSPSVVTSTIVVAGAGTSLIDVNLQTFIQHTFSADLDVTITSPAGTVVTLTTDNGAGNDNVFNGTVWDDSANPGGQVPYVSNDGMVTDQLYVNGTVASPLTPEEALAAFVGEDPNGTWTLTISDDSDGDGGSLDSWSMDIKTFACASADLSITKTDNVLEAAPGGTTTYTIIASNAGPDPAADAVVSDTFPAGETCTWTCGGAGGGVCTAAGSGNLNDTANLPSGGSVTYSATCSISNSASGTLANTAMVSSSLPDPDNSNNSATDTDTLVAHADLSITKTDGVTTATPGGTVTYTITASNAGPSNATGATVADTFPASETCSWTCSGTAGGTCTASGSGNLSDTVDLPAGASVTYAATCNVAIDAIGALSNTATVTAPAGVTDDNPGNNLATDTDTLSAVPAASISGTKTVSHAGADFTRGSNVVYTIVLTNSGDGAQGDNPGDEFVDALSPSLVFVSVASTSGAAVFSGGAVHWNGGIPSGGSVTITITATIGNTASGTIGNQGTFFFDGDGNGTNESSGVTDDPGIAGTGDATSFVVAVPGQSPVVATPGLRPLGLFLLMLGLAAAAFIRRRSRQ